MLSVQGSSEGRSFGVEASLHLTELVVEYPLVTWLRRSPAGYRDASTAEDRPLDDPPSLSMTKGKVSSHGYHSLAKCAQHDKTCGIPEVRCDSLRKER